VVSRDWIKKDYILKQVPCPLIVDTTKNEYPYQSTDVFFIESPDKFLIKRQGPIYSRCRHLCPCCPPTFAASLWFQRCEMKINMTPKNYNYNTVACSGRKARRKVREYSSCVGNWVYFGRRGIGMCKSRDVEVRMLTGVYYRRKRDRCCWRKEGIYILVF
jgi:hypothetical protein